MNDTSVLPNAPRVKVVAGYALQQKLGSGSFAVVYKGHKIKPTGAPDDLQRHQSHYTQQRETHQEGSAKSRN